MYFDTVKETPENVDMFTTSNLTQNEAVLQIAKDLKQKGIATFSPSKIFIHFPSHSTPLTSIRRAINTLKRNRKIVETGNMVKGLYTRNEKEYELLID